MQDEKTKLLRTLAPHVPLDLLQATSSVLQDVFTKPPGQILTRLARQLLKLTGSRSTSVLVFRTPDDGQLRVEAHAWVNERDRISYKTEFGTVTLPSEVEVEMRQGHPILTGGAGAQALLSDIARAAGQSASTTGTGCLIAPLYDRKRTTIVGVLVVGKSRSSAGSRFGQDEFIAAVMAEIVELVIEKMSLLAAQQGVVADIHPAKGLSGILARAVKLVGADRGDFALWSESKNDLIITTVYGERTDFTAWEKHSAPDPGFIRACWSDPKKSFRIADDVMLEDQYHITDPGIRSGLAVRFESSERAIGVLNVESTKKAWFDEQDIQGLQLLSTFAVAVIQSTELNNQLYRLTQVVMEQSASLDETLEQILRGILDVFGFQGGIVWMFDERNKTLVRRAFRGRSDNPAETTRSVTSKSFATHVFNLNAIYRSVEPECDDVVDQEGARNFGVTGALIGFPLRFRTTSYGCLVLWASVPLIKGRRIERDVQPFIDLIASRIAYWKSEHDVKESRELYDSLVDHIPQYIIRKDLSGKVVFANRAYCELLGCTLEEIQGKTDHILYREDLASLYRRSDLELLNSDRETASQDEVHEIKGRPPMNVSVTKVKIRDAHENIVGIQCVFQDVTTQRKVRKELHDLLDRQKDTFEDLAHQLKGPLAQASQRAEKLLADAPDRWRDELAIVSGHCRKALRVTKSLRLLADVSRGEGIRTNVELLDRARLGTLLADAIDDAKLESADALTIVCDMAQLDPVKAVKISLDYDLLEQAVGNLLNNAVKYSFKGEHGEPVTVDCSVVDGQLCICVSNVGIPLVKSSVSQCCERGWRSEHAEATTGEGSGIGLWIVNHIMVAHEGSLRVFPTNAEGVTKFSIFFPSKQ